MSVNINDKVFTQSDFVDMIINDRNEVIACKQLLRNIGKKHFFLSCLLNAKCPLLFFYIKIGTLWNEKSYKKQCNKIKCSCLEIFLGGKV